MIQGTQKYRFYGSLNAGAIYTELFLNNYPKISNKPESNEIFYRFKSDEWVIQKWKNLNFYLGLIPSLQNPCSVTLDILFQVRTASETLYTGSLKVNNVAPIDETTGIISLSPTSVDDYGWWDLNKDTIYIPSVTHRAVQYSTTSVEYSFEVELDSQVVPTYGGMADCDIVGTAPKIIRYKQQRIPFVYPGYLEGNGIFEDFYGTEPYAETVPKVGATNCPRGVYYKDSCTVETLPPVVLGTSFMRLDEIINDVIFKMESGLTLSSTFLNAYANPITGPPNNFNNIVIGLLADIFGVNGKNREFTFDGLMSIIKKWGCFWWVDGSSLRIENIKTIMDARTGGIDLTDAIYNTPKYLTLQNINGVATDNVYSFKLDVPLKEEFIYEEGDDRIGTIVYNNALADDNTKKHELRGVMADVIKLISFPDSLSEDTYMILATDVVSEYVYKIREESDGSTNILNYHLSWDKILNNYWLNDRPFFSGLINGVAVTFHSIQHMKIQKTLSFPDLENQYDVNKYITTNLGAGLIDSIELDTENGFFTVTLKHTACV